MTATLDPLDELRTMAEEVASTIAGDLPDIDTSHDLYVEQLDGETFGLIDMGDAYREAFVWSEAEGEWTTSTVDTYALEERILAARRSTGY